MYKNILIVTCETDLDFSSYDNAYNYIIGVERGCLDLIKKQVKIDLAVADFDHVTDHELEIIKLKAKNMQVLDKNKDILDGEMAVQIAKNIDKMANIFFIAKPTKRYDMNFSAINVVNKYDVKLINDESFIFLIKKGLNQLENFWLKDFRYVSFFATVTTKLTIEKMKYNIENLVLKQFENTAISNELVNGQVPCIKTNKNIICIATK